MLTTQAYSQVVIGHLMGVLNLLMFSRMINGHNVVFIVNINVFVDTALAKLHRATMKANISMKATS